MLLENFSKSQGKSIQVKDNTPRKERTEKVKEKELASLIQLCVKTTNWSFQLCGQPKFPGLIQLACVKSTQTDTLKVYVKCGPQVTYISSN